MDFIEMYQVSVIERTWLSDCIYLVSIERPQGYTFTPGDCLAVFDRAKVGSRPYSIASGTSDVHLQLLIRNMPGGDVSGYLATCDLGEVIQISPPFGWFRPGEHGTLRPFTFWATGTGVAPFRSWARSGGQAPVTLFHGVRTHQDGARICNELKETMPVTLAVSREHVEGCHHGRITDLLGEIEVDMDYYLCGLDTMIDEMASRLVQGGVPPRNIHRECFFNADVDA